MDRWALHRLQEVIRRVRNAYDNYQFHIVYYALYNFCTVEMSSLYLDVLKDRLYTSRADSRERRSAQTAIYTILDAMVRLLAPILTFTAEEIWENLPAREGKEESIHMAQFPEFDDALFNRELGERWQTLIAVRGEISKAIELARKNKVVGHSLDCRVDLYAPEKLRKLLQGYSAMLKHFLIVSQVRLCEEDTLTEPFASTEFEGLKIGVAKAVGEKCERCWNYSETVGRNGDHPTICERCLNNL